jgi:uncharacterized membrane protein YdjX (TVP38/TMEM64 family)
MLGAGVLGALFFLARESSVEIAARESWIAGLGAEGWVVFVVAAILLMAVFVPSSVLGALAGALFGLGWGTMAMGIGGLITASVTWLIASRLLRDQIGVVLRRYPKLQAIHRAVRSHGTRFQFMLRLAPLNAVAINYVLGAAGVRFLPFMLAALGMLPGLFLEVYFGHLARHVTQVAGNHGSASTVETVTKAAGFVLCVVTMIAVGKMARRAVAEAETRMADPIPGSVEEAAPDRKPV